ncbi:hypothetical protein, partial [Micromonospora echinofusca]
PPTQPLYGAPQSAPPGYGVPQSSPPTQPMYGAPQSAPPGGPVSGAPVPAQPGYPGAPMSGAPFGEPMSGPPAAAYGAPATGGAGKGRTALILGIVAGLLFVLGGVMTGLYLSKSNELERTERQLTAQVKERDTTIGANTKEIEKLKTDLQSAKDKLEATQQDLTGTKNDRDEQARQKQVIAKCLDKLTTALSAAAANNRTAYNAAIKDLDKVCDEAEKYL